MGYYVGMRTIQDALAYIDTMIAYCLEIPEMYAANPVSLEGILMQLDNLAAFIRSDDDQPILVNRSRYSEFIRSKGFGATQFASWHRAEPIAIEHNRAAFQPLCDFWREYLSVRDLPAPFPEPSYD